MTSTAFWCGARAALLLRSADSVRASIVWQDRCSQGEVLTRWCCEVLLTAGVGRAGWHPCAERRLRAARRGLCPRGRTDGQLLSYILPAASPSWRSCSSSSSSSAAALAAPLLRGRQALQRDDLKSTNASRARSGHAARQLCQRDFTAQQQQQQQRRQTADSGWCSFPSATGCAPEGHSRRSSVQQLCTMMRYKNLPAAGGAGAKPAAAQHAQQRARQEINAAWFHGS